MPEIGYATQLGLLLLLVGLWCLFKPYSTAKWHANDPEIEKRLFKRQQSHKPKKERQKYRRDPDRQDVEPTAFSVNVFRVLGAAAAVSGAALTVWSFL